MVKSYLDATCDPEDWNRVTPGEKMLMQLCAMTDPVYFWNEPRMGNFPLWQSKIDMLNKFYTYNGNKRKYQELIWISGMRGGKTALAGLISLTEIYKLLMLKDPQKYYKLTPNTEITTINVANSRDQAKDTVFRKIEEIVSNSPYLMAQKPDLTAFQLKFPKNIVTKALGSNLGSAVGRTVKCFVADEVADYDDPEDTYQKLSKSTANFGKWGENIRVMIGSPGLVSDYLVTYYEQAKREKWENTISFYTATWDTNPEIEYDEKERQKDPIRYDRDLGGKPMSEIENLFNPNLLAAAGNRSGQFQSLFIGHPTRGDRSEFIPMTDMDRLKAASDATDYYVTVDPAIKHDAFGLAVGYLSINEEAKCIGSTVFKAAYNEEIHTEDIKKVLRPIFEKLHVKYYIYDVYLHSELQQLAAEHGITCIQHNLNVNDWVYTRNDLYNGVLSVPYSDYLWKEFRELTVIKDKKVDHPRSGSKDEADAVCQFNSFIRRQQEEERLNSNPAVTHFVGTF